MEKFSLWTKINTKRSLSSQSY